VRKRVQKGGVLGKFSLHKRQGCYHRPAGEMVAHLVVQKLVKKTSGMEMGIACRNGGKVV
jgi:hypothetical protein